MLKNEKTRNCTEIWGNKTKMTKQLKKATHKYLNAINLYIIWIFTDDEAYEAYLEEEERQKCKAKLKKEQAELLEEWKKCGKVRYRHEWRYHSPSHVAGLVHKAESWSGWYTKTVIGECTCGIVCIAHHSESKPDVIEVPACKYLHLRSKHNQLAHDIHRYIKLSFDGVFVEVRIKLFKMI